MWGKEDCLGWTKVNCWGKSQFDLWLALADAGDERRDDAVHCRSLAQQTLREI